MCYVMWCMCYCYPKLKNAIRGDREPTCESDGGYTHTVLKILICNNVILA